MKVVAFNGSPRSGGNTAAMIGIVLEELSKSGIETEMVQLGGNIVAGCRACRKCAENRDGRCAVEGDIINDCIGKMRGADGIVLGSPTYFANVTTEMKALIDRAGLVALSNDRMLKRRVGAAVVAVRRAGSTRVFNSINHFFLINEMIIPGSIYWNCGLGSKAGELMNDREGVETMRALGRNMAWLLERTGSLS
jgi:multimeric flavodoxin WrbA